MGTTRDFTPEEITAMLFTKLKDTAEEALNTKVKDVVIGCPCYFTDRERRGLMDAASIAGKDQSILLTCPSILQRLNILSFL
jgi:heat shock protein 4